MRCRSAIWNVEKKPVKCMVLSSSDMRAIQFFLKTQAGWSEKNQLQIEAVKNEPEQTNVEIKVVDSMCPKCKAIDSLDDDE